MKWTNIIVALTALYGAILSTCNTLKNKRSLQIKSYPGEKIQNNNMNPNLVIDIANTSEKEIIIKHPYLKLRDGTRLYFPKNESNTQFPKTLLPTQNCRIYIDIKVITTKLQNQGYSNNVEMIPEVKDGTGKIYYPKKFFFFRNYLNFNINEWA